MAHQAPLKYVFYIAATPEKVWRALTDPVLLAEWLLPVVGLKLEPGAAFTFKAPPQPGWDGVTYCRVIEIDPPRTLACTRSGRSNIGIRRGRDARG